VAKVATDRTLHGRRLTSTGNRFVNNIVVDAETGNEADYNVYVSTRAEGPAVKDEGAHTVAMTGLARLDEALMFEWKPARPLTPAPPVKGCGLDFFGRPRSGEDNVAGPFLALRSAATMRLRVDR
jgi:hypothetical protein